MSLKQEKILECKNVSFSYGQEKVLDGVTFELKSGQYLGLIGPNGGGKSTLVKILLGILKAKKGSIIKSPNINIGYVPQRLSSMASFFPATVLEIVSSGLPRNNSSNVTPEQSLKMVGITDLKRKLIGELSGGQLQKVFIARALVSDPKILILDEPAVGIDPHATAKFYAILKKLNKEKNITIVLVSHDLDVVNNEVDTVFCLNKTMICRGHKLDLMNEKTLKKLYGDSFKLVNHKHA